MCFFRKKKTGAKAKEDRELVNGKQQSHRGFTFIGAEK